MTIDEIPVAADTDRVSDEAGGLFLYCINGVLFRVTIHDQRVFAVGI